MWTLLIVGVSGVALFAAAIFGDPTEKGTVRGVGAAANFGKDRAPVQPVVIEPFENVKKLSDRELGRIVHMTGTAESGVRRAAVYVRTPSGRRILVRFEPTPTPEQLRGVYNGGGVNVNGYLMKISRAEFNVWMDTLGVVIPRPKPGVKFGDLPDSNFMRVDSLFIKDYYISVRPEGIGRGGAPPPVAPTARLDTSAASRPAAAAPPPAPAPAAPPPVTEEPPAAEPAGRDTVRP
ncbi:MAG TPA: hypothetical protein VFJ82_04920 [Longimicrobium sp.]|nr:hypothetical protein [Longimicrobium sp.]